MRAKATKRKLSFYRPWQAAFLGWVLFGVFALNAPPAEAARKTKHSKHSHPRKPSAAQQKLRAALEQAQEKNGESASRLGAASFYGFGFQGRRAASGERFNVRNLTAASNNYPLGSWVAVRRLDNERCVVVKVNDRMHAKHKTRIIDLSRSAAEQLRMISAGVILVRVALLAEAPGEDQVAACQHAFAAESGATSACSDCPAPVVEELPLPSLPSLSDMPNCSAAAPCDPD